jgi:hypothetical protein
MSRNKGARGEREVAKLFESRGWEAVRTPASGGMQWKGDLQHNIPGLHTEIKFCEKWCIPAWIKQAEADAPEGTVPAVILRRSRDIWRILVPLDHYLDLRSA